MENKNYPLVFKGVQSILKVFKQHEEEQGVAELLSIYDKAKEKASKCNNSEKNHPFIVFEGLDASGKTTLTRNLAKKRGAKLMNTPPASVEDIRGLFDKHPLLRTAYYSLGNYIASEEIKVQLQKSPVVLDRYWHSTVAFAIAQAVHNSKDLNLPEEGDSFYIWPEDLLKPDVVLYLDVKESVRLERIARRKNETAQESLLASSAEFRKNILTAYERMKNPGIIKVNSNKTIKETLQEAVAILRRFGQSTCNFHQITLATNIDTIVGINFQSDIEE